MDSLLGGTHAKPSMNPRARLRRPATARTTCAWRTSRRRPVSRAEWCFCSGWKACLRKARLRAKRPDVCFVVVGSGMEEAALKARLADPALRDRLVADITDNLRRRKS